MNRQKQNVWLLTLPMSAVAVGLSMAAPDAAWSSSLTTSIPGSPVTPSSVDVFLTPDEDPVTFDVSVEVGNPSALDVFLLNDLSSSFFIDLPNVKAAIPSLVSGLNAISSDVLLGMGSFIDKPIDPFGLSTDYVYQTEISLTNDFANLQSTVNGLKVRGGRDSPESQLEALMQAALRKTEVGWRDDAFSVIVLQTDAKYHQAGDGLKKGLVPNNGDAIIDPAEDYPSILQTRDALLAANIIPIFAATSSARSDYQTLVDDWGFGSVVELSSDSSNLVEAISLGLGDVLQDVKLFIESDEFDYVQEVASDFTSKKTGIDFDVPDGGTAKFTRTGARARQLRPMCCGF